MTHDQWTGPERRDAATELLETLRAVYLRRCRRAVLGLLLDGAETITADDVRAGVELPSDVDARLIGAAIRGLSQEGLIRPVGIATSARPERHAGILRTWCLADRDAARQWMIDHPDISAPPPPQQKDQRRLPLVDGWEPER